MPMRLIPTREFALYQLDPAGTQTVAADPEPFDAERYSSYKHGSTAAAEWFAQRLAAAFLARNPQAMGFPRVLIASSPYHLVPAASAALARGFRTAFNAARTAATGLAAAPLVQIERMVTTTGDYAVLSAGAREECMAANSLSFSKLNRHELHGAHLIVVDDVKVTGAHQRCLIRASRELPLGSRTFLYTAAVSGADASFDPAMEHRLNHARISTLEDFAAMLRERVGDFAWNVRVCKFLLGPQNRAELPGFLARMPGRFIRELYRHSLADGYASMTAYRDSFALITAELRRRDLGTSEELRAIPASPRRHAGTRPSLPVLAAAVPARSA
jgi:predicted amidophosphoribosyltransferase